jgi:hypothetical protein
MARPFALGALSLGRFRPFVHLYPPLVLLSCLVASTAAPAAGSLAGAPGAAGAGIRPGQSRHGHGGADLSVKRCPCRGQQRWLRRAVRRLSGALRCRSRRQRIPVDVSAVLPLVGNGLHPSGAAHLAGGHPVRQRLQWGHRWLRSLPDRFRWLSGVGSFTIQPVGSPHCGRARRRGSRPAGRGRGLQDRPADPGDRAPPSHALR